MLSLSSRRARMGFSLEGNGEQLSAEQYAGLFVLAIAPGVTLALACLLSLPCRLGRQASPPPRASDGLLLTHLIQRLRSAVMSEAAVRRRIRLSCACASWAFVVLGQGAFNHLIARMSEHSFWVEKIALPTGVLSMLERAPEWRLLLVIPFMIALRPTDAFTVRLAVGIASIIFADVSFSVRQHECQILGATRTYAATSACSLLGSVRPAVRYFRCSLIYLLKRCP